MKPLTNYDRQLIKCVYGSVKQYNQLKKDKRSYDLYLIELDEKVKNSSMIDPRIEMKKAIEEQTNINSIKQSIREALYKNNPFTYKQFLISYDILGNNFNQVIADFNKEKITQNDIRIVIDYINSYSDKVINEYWIEQLLQVA